MDGSYGAHSGVRLTLGTATSAAVSPPRWSGEHGRCSNLHAFNVAL